MVVPLCASLSVASGVCRDRDSVPVGELALYNLKGVLEFLKMKITES